MIDLASIRTASREEMPVIDMAGFDGASEADTEALGQRIIVALETSGFLVLVNHGVGRAVIEGAFEAARQFHALPMPEKSALALGDGFVGYLPSGEYVIKTSTVNRNDKADVNASFFFERERLPDDPEVVAKVPFRSVNKWPYALPGFRDRCLRYLYAMEGLALTLLPAIARGLGVGRDYFDAAFLSPQTAVRLSHYPATRYEANQFGIAPHTDSNFLTFLPQSEVEGLTIKSGHAEWVKAPRIEGAISVNSGDFMRRWTNERIKSTQHFAANLSPRDRYAIPVFMAPNTRYRVETIPTCIPAGEEPRYPPVCYEELRLWFMRTNYRSKASEGGPAAAERAP